MHPETRLVRGLLGTIASLFLIGGVAFAANGQGGASSQADPAGISPTVSPTSEATETAEPTEAAETA